MHIPFFKTTIIGKELKYIEQILSSPDSFAEKNYVAKCEDWFRENHGVKNFFLTKSCTDSLELAALVIGIREGDEVILPSYAFVACSNAFAMRGATCVFVDIHPETMNLDEEKVDAAITPKTKAILALNYASVGCRYNSLTAIAKKHNLFLIEDNAHGINAKDERGSFLGTHGDIATFSFDHLKNVTCGQGGGIAINNESLLENFFVNYEFGTNRRAFFLGNSNRYEWKNLGSNYPISNLNAAMLFAQLENVDLINSRFTDLMYRYFEELGTLSDAGKIELPNAARKGKNNGHCFFIKTKNSEERNTLIKHLVSVGINAQFHYTPLHSSEFGRQAGRFVGEDEYTTREATRLLRLPLFYTMEETELLIVTNAIKDFYQ